MYFFIFFIQWGWKTEKSSIWSGNSAMFGKKLAARGNKQESIPDPLLSPFICNVPIPNYNNNHPDENSSLSNKDIEIHNAERYGSFSPRDFEVVVSWHNKRNLEKLIS